jgi:septal ring factor EnvC (AmiA/AmiB activator)
LNIRLFRPSAIVPSRRHLLRMATSAQQLLDETNDAISACLKSQSYTVAERSQQRAKLQELQQFRTQLLQEIQDGSGGGQMSSVGQINRPS